MSPQGLVMSEAIRRTLSKGVHLGWRNLLVILGAVAVANLVFTLDPFVWGLADGLIEWNEDILSNQPGILHYQFKAVATAVIGAGWRWARLALWVFVSALPLFFQKGKDETKAEDEGREKESLLARSLELAIPLVGVVWSLAAIRWMLFVALYIPTLGVQIIYTPSTGNSDTTVVIVGVVLRFLDGIPAVQLIPEPIQWFLTLQETYSPNAILSRLLVGIFFLLDAAIDSILVIGVSFIVGGAVAGTRKKIRASSPCKNHRRAFLALIGFSLVAYPILYTIGRAAGFWSYALFEPLANAAPVTWWWLQLGDLPSFTKTFLGTLLEWVMRWPARPPLLYLNDQPVIMLLAVPFALGSAIAVGYTLRKLQKHKELKMQASIGL